MIVVGVARVASVLVVDARGQKGKSTSIVTAGSCGRTTTRSKRG